MLHFASIQGCLVSCLFLFLVEEAGLDVNSESKAGVTPMVLAALQGNVEVTRYLLDHGGDPAMPDERGSTPLHNAAAAGHCEAVRLLLSKGVNLDPIHYQGTRLHLAAVEDQDQVVMVLLEHGADHGAIPIELAADSDRHKLVQILFPRTKPIKSLPDWSVDGIIKTVNSPKINAPPG
uniref:Uncharacterized protein n=1 Tax=Aegilops tauschii subsp. strangulata TaxID=200361 RepID=A0A453JRY1_AEGTS